MEFIVVQLIIVATVFGAHRVSPTLAFWLSVAWMIENVWLHSSAPLIVLQTIVIWGTYFGLRIRAGQEPPPGQEPTTPGE